MNGQLKSRFSFPRLLGNWGSGWQDEAQTFPPKKGEYGLPQWLRGKESACQGRRCRRWGFNPRVRKIPWRGKRQPFQYSCLENPMDRGAQQAIVHGVTESQTQLSTHAQRDEIDGNCLFTEKTGLFEGNIIPFLGLIWKLQIGERSERGIGTLITIWCL